MPRAITDKMSLDDVENEILYTVAAVKADPDAASHVGATAHWLDLVDKARASDRTARAAIAETSASRNVANVRLDGACTAFGDELLLAKGRDPENTEFRVFFPVPIRQFVKQALPAQIGKVNAWLKSKDPVLKKHRSGLERWNKAAAAALAATEEIAMIRGKAHIAREQLAADLTRERDGLHDTLAAVARNKRLPRDWADLFFRAESHSASTASAPPSEGSDPTAGEAPQSATAPATKPRKK